MELEGNGLHFAMIGCPGVGHLTPILELAQRLIHQHTHLKITIFITSSTSSNSDLQLLQPLVHKIQEEQSHSINIHHLPPVDISSVVEEGATFVTMLYLMMREARAGFRDALVGMEENDRPNVLVVDVFGLEYFEIAEEFGMRKYVFVTSNAWFFALAVYVPVLDEMVEGEYVDQRELICVPGCRGVRPEDVIEVMTDRSNQQYQEFLRTGCLYPTADGFLINTWEDLEAGLLEAFREEGMLGSVVKGPVYCVGPVVAPADLACGDMEVFRWLDGQPSESVIFVAFGSGGTLSVDQITELAWGLELTGQLFVWVVRPPATAIGQIESTDPSHYLPDGFLDRTKELGVMIYDWAPQREILNHPSIGGFLTHCGWNSSLESIMSGVPMVAWPLYAEQRMNATLLVEEFKVAVRPATLSAKQVVDREEIKMLVAEIMSYDGNELRGRVKELKLGGEMALRVGGSSWTALNRMVEENVLKFK